MEKAQGLPITTVVLIVICILVLVVIILFFLGGFGSGQSSVNTFQCQQQCQTINVLITGKQMCCTRIDNVCLNNVNSLKSFCSGKCDTKVACALPKIDNGCGYNAATGCNSPMLTCNPSTNAPSISC